MSEQHVTSETLQRLRRRELPPDELLKVLRHVGGCSDCSGTAGAWVPSRLTLEADAGTEAEHLDPETQLFPWVDGTIDPAGREIVETHLEDCAMCRAEAADLREWTGGAAAASAPEDDPEAEAASPPPGRYLWAAAAALVVVVGTVVVSRRPEAPVDVPTPPRAAPRAPAYANAEWNALVADAVRTGRLPVPGRLEELRPPVDPLRGGESGKTAPLSPQGIVVATPRPQFRWPAAKGQATYAVAVFDGSIEVAASEALRTPEWTPPSDLPAERTLAWQVEITRGGTRSILPAPPAPPALFRIAAAADRAQLDAARSQHPNDHLLHAVLLARAGLLAEADAALQRATAAGDRRTANIARVP